MDGTCCKGCPGTVPRRQSPGVSWADLLGEVTQLQELLEAPDQLLASIKVQQGAVEAYLNDLETQLHESRSAISCLTEKVQQQVTFVETQEEISLIPINDPAVEDSTILEKSLEKPGETEGKERGEEEEAEEEEDEEDEARKEGTLMAKIMELDTSSPKHPPLSAVLKKGWWRTIEWFCRILVHSPRFEYAISCVILVNAIVIGVETDLSAQGLWVEWTTVLEIVFLVIYTLEIVVRLIADKMKCFCDYWFLFDCLLVVISLFGQIFAAVATVPSIIQQVLVLRALRLLRLIRALRMIRQMRTIWRLVFGLLTSCDTMISTLALLVLVLYIFAVLGVEMIANDETLREDAGTKAIIELNFSGIFVTMMTLSQFVTMDSIASIYFPLINKKGSLSIYFTLLVIT
ncbi:unnamed protein product, partial [Effrenium voratum]